MPRHFRSIAVESAAAGNSKTWLEIREFPEFPAFSEFAAISRLVRRSAHFRISEMRLKIGYFAPNFQEFLISFRRFYIKWKFEISLRIRESRESSGAISQIFYKLGILLEIGHFYPISTLFEPPYANITPMEIQNSAENSRISSIAWIRSNIFWPRAQFGAILHSRNPIENWLFFAQFPCIFWPFAVESRADGNSKYPRPISRYFRPFAVESRAAGNSK